MASGTIKVGEIMQTHVHMIDGLAQVATAITEMDKLVVSSLVVDRRDEDDEYGIVTVHDIAAKVIAGNRSSRRTNVYEIMTKPAVALSPTMNVKYAIRLLSKLGLNRALVTDGRTLLGLVTLRDLLVNYPDTRPEAARAD